MTTSKTATRPAANKNRGGRVQPYRPSAGGRFVISGGLVMAPVNRFRDLITEREALRER
jgi:hypothetical protein